MRKKDMTNAQLLTKFFYQSCRITNYPNNNSEYKEWERCAKELAKRLNLTDEETQELLDE